MVAAQPLPVQCPPSVLPPATPAWTMQSPSNSLQLLDETFSVFEPESSPTRLP
ncbi:lysis system o-spanin lipoprotein Rz1 [Pseudomonas sp. PS02302]|uniref:lysis system o-spanin lipoprotein Rz1 n=1 Tax=Pseudomonas sp. PS02302 TaxID=2991428 RepID=UPI003FA6F958